MRLGIMAGYSGAQIQIPFDMIQEADRLGYYAVWTAEAYGSDAITPLAWIGALTKHIKLGTAIMQMPARTPAMTAMTAVPSLMFFVSAPIHASGVIASEP